MLRYVSIFMALYFLNISIDAKDALPFNVPENLEVNEQESIIELVLEKMLGYNDIIAEYDDADNEDTITLKKTFTVDWFVLPADKNNSSCALHIFSKKKINTFCFSGHYNSYSEIVSPPPEV